MKKFIIGIDVGGTKVAGGLVTRKGKLSQAQVVPTLADKPFEKSLAQITHLIGKLIRAAGGKENVGGIGICAPGPLNPKTGIVLNPPNLPNWRNIELAKLVEKEFGLPAKLENDANAAGLAEVLFGAAVGFKDVFYVTVSTGVGTGIITNGKIYHGKNGIAGEGGHVSVDYHSPYRCGCGTLGCIEALAAGPGMARRARVMLEQEHSLPSLLRDLTRGHSEEISPKLIQEAASKGDKVAKKVLDDTGFFLGIWLAGMVSLFDPDAIVIGGGVSHIGKPLFDKIKETIPNYTVNGFAASTPVLPAKLRNNVGVYGAASVFLPAGEEAEA
jgi:glucokinase